MRQHVQIVKRNHAISRVELLGRDFIKKVCSQFALKLKDPECGLWAHT